MAWSDRYVGIPYEDHGRDILVGLDCWGLVMEVYRNELGVKLPSYSDRYVTAADRELIARIMQGDAAKWTRVPGRPVAFDLVLMEMAGWASHVGLVVTEGWMLHSPGPHASVVEQYTSGRYAHRVVGIFRWTNEPDNQGPSAR